MAITRFVTGVESGAAEGEYSSDEYYQVSEMIAAIQRDWSVSDDDLHALIGSADWPDYHSGYRLVTEEGDFFAIIEPSDHDWDRGICDRCRTMALDDDDLDTECPGFGPKFFD